MTEYRCEFRDKRSKLECGQIAISIWRLDCPNCDQHMIRTYCPEHTHVIEMRLEDDARVICTECKETKYSRETYTALGAA